MFVLCFFKDVANVELHKQKPMKEEVAMSNFNRECNVELNVGKIVKWGLSILLVIIVVGLFVDWLAAGENFILYKFWAPKLQAVQREVFVNTPSYVLGIVQELENFQVEYLKADESHQKALAAIILHRAATIPEDKMPSDLREFVKKLKDERADKVSSSNQFK